jgi:hypothetical protein
MLLMKDTSFSICHLWQCSHVLTSCHYDHHHHLLYQSEGQRMNSYTVWLRNAPTTAQAMQRQQQRPTNKLLDDPLRPFAIFDLMLRVSLAGTLGLMVLVTLRQD